MGLFDDIWGGGAQETTYTYDEASAQQARETADLMNQWAEEDRERFADQYAAQDVANLRMMGYTVDENGNVSYIGNMQVIGQDAAGNDIMRDVSDVAMEEFVRANSIYNVLGDRQVADAIRQNLLDNYAAIKSEDVYRKYYEAATRDLEREYTTAARADVAGAIAQQEEASRRGLSRMGIDPTSGAFADATQRADVLRAQALGGAVTEARRTAQQQELQNLQGAMQTAQAISPQQQALGAGIGGARPEYTTGIGTFYETEDKSAQLLAQAGNIYTQLGSRVMSQETTGGGAGLGDIFGAVAGGLASGWASEYFKSD